MAQAGIDFAPHRAGTMPVMSTAEHQPLREWLTPAEVVALTGCSARTLRRWAQCDGWRARLDMLTGGHAPTRFYARADVLASVRAVSGHLADGAQVGATADDGEGVQLPAVGQRLELMQVRHERLSPGLAECLDALNRHAAALEAQAQRRTWWDHVAELVAGAALIWRR